MPQRAQLLLKLAQTAAKAGGQVTQVSALPKVAQDVYDTIREAQAANQHQQQQSQGPRLPASTAMLPDGLLHGFGRLSGGRAQQAPLLPHSLPLHGSLAVGQPSRLKHQPQHAQQQQHERVLVQGSAPDAPAQPVAAHEAQQAATSHPRTVAAAPKNSSSAAVIVSAPAEAARAGSDVRSGHSATSAVVDAARGDETHQPQARSPSSQYISSQGQQSAAARAAVQPEAAPGSTSQAAVREQPTSKQPHDDAKPISQYQDYATEHAAYLVPQHSCKAGRPVVTQPAQLDGTLWPGPGSVASKGDCNMPPPTPIWTSEMQYTGHAAVYGAAHAAASVPRPILRQSYVQQAPHLLHLDIQQMPMQRKPAAVAQRVPGQQQQQQQGAKPGKAGSNVSLNKQIMAAYGVRELAALVRTKGQHFDFFNISSAVARVPKLVGANGSNSCGSAQLDGASKALVDDLAALMARSISTFDARGLANAAWAFGKLRYSSNQRLPALIAEHAVPKMGDFSPQNLSNLLWACVYLHFRSEALLQAAAEEVLQKLGMFKPQELANTLWALASLDYRCPGLLSSAAQRCIEIAPAFKEQELSNVVWAFARLRYDEPRLRAALLYQVDAKLGALQPQGVANVAWALAASHTAGPAALPGSWGPTQGPAAGAGHKAMHTATVHASHPGMEARAVSGSYISEQEVEAARQLLARLVARALPSLGLYDAQGLSNLVWAMGALGVRDGVAVRALLSAAAAKGERMGAQQLCNVLCGCAGLGWTDGAALASWAQQVVAKADAFDGQAVANTAWAFAQLGHHDAVLFDALADAAAAKVDSMTPEACARMAWAMSVARCQHPLHERLMQQAPAQEAHMPDQQQSAWAVPAQWHQEREQQAAYALPSTLGQLHSAEHLQHLQHLASHFASPASMLNSADSHDSSGGSSMSDAFCMDGLYSADDAPVTPPQGTAQRGLLYGGFGPFGVDWAAAGASPLPAAAEGNDPWFGGAALKLYGM